MIEFNDSLLYPRQRRRNIISPVLEVSAVTHHSVKNTQRAKLLGDLKEFWHFGQFVEDNDPIVAEYPDNVNVDEIQDFLSVGKEAYQTFERTGAHLLRAIARHLKLEEEYFAPFVHNGNSILRPIHYPPILGEIEDGAVRAGEHEDINLITLLVGRFSRRTSGIE
jgi:isopenicillin N synthase-like dioxygenase